jgi:hypothetical protein
MGAVAASGAVIGSLILFRFLVYSAVVLLCRQAQQLGQPFEAEVGWSLALKLKTGPTPTPMTVKRARSRPGMGFAPDAQGQQETPARSKSSIETASLLQGPGVPLQAGDVNPD